jgi:ligand-binding SRPBCC domain-containing protein
LRVFQRSFRIKAPLQTVVEFHRMPGNMAVLTPPPVLVRIHKAPSRLSDGSEMAFTMWLGPLPVHWIASIEKIDGEGFMDRQLSGPFGSWVHHHSFRFIGEHETEIQDRIEFSLKKHLLWGPVGLVMGLSLPLLFAYRRWKTRRLLQ